MSIDSGASAKRDLTLGALQGVGGGTSLVEPDPVAPDVASLMRVDHAGEVCAQALYLSQSVFARSPEVRSLMSRSASEEEAHLRLTKTRLDELGARTSALNPLWFAGSLAVGALAAMIGDRFSLGFLAETEIQVAQHLDGHLRQLALEDRDSRSALRRMRADELAHASLAIGEGGIEFPLPARIAMRATAKVMTTMAARI